MPIAKYEGQTFTKKVFQLEECWFVNCVLHECVLFYSGGSFEFENTHFDACQWKFQNAAQRTCGLLSMLGILGAQESMPAGPLTSGQVH
jgi:hypothetical protein